MLSKSSPTVSFANLIKKVFMNITQLPTNLSILEQAEAEVAKERGAKHLKEMKALIQQRESTKDVLRSIEAQIEDLSIKIANKTN
jgi:hypothetical protein